MKSTKTMSYNHRTAQSKASWETNFLSKINSGNSLLYLAAVKSNSYAKIDDSYYTEQNKPAILSTLDGIVTNPYNQRFHKVFETYLADAKRILDEKIQKSAPKPAQQQQQQAPGGIRAEESQDGQTKFKSNVQTYEGDQIRDILKNAYLIAEKDPKQLKFQWEGMRKQILALWSSIDPNERTEFNQDIRALDLKMNEQFSPQGGTMSARGTFFAYTIEQLEQMLMNAMRSRDANAANDAVAKIQILRNQDPQYMPYIETARRLNLEISKYNGRNIGTDAQKINTIK